MPSSGRPPLPDTGQWLLLALNEKLPEAVVEILRAHIIGLHHYLMLFIMLAFSVLFESVKAPGLGLGARYMFTMAVGRLLRANNFCVYNSAISPPMKYYVPYASDANAIRQVIERDIAYVYLFVTSLSPEVCLKVLLFFAVDTVNYTADYRPDWGSMSFLIDFLRPNTSEGSSWYSLLKKAGGGCNDLVYSGHMFVAVLTAMAWTHNITTVLRLEMTLGSLLRYDTRKASSWTVFAWDEESFTVTEAYGGFSSVLIWLLVMHSAQREVRERHHYSVDCVVAIYVGILLWKMTGFIWSAKGGTGDSRLTKLGKIQGRLLQAAKDSDMDEVRELLKDVELGNQESLKQGPSKVMWLFASGTIFFSLTIVILAFTWTSDG
ncbi:hypothetical protein GOBAR_DD11933 [Gossypium barbadense]|nr:hypothetical protein GOBAR_DD11933 [Gossypium barbadense]